MRLLSLREHSPTLKIMLVRGVICELSGRGCLGTVSGQGVRE
jgi:hypothetical protein